MQGLPLWVATTALAGGALFLLRQGSRAFWRLRTITDTPTARIQSAPQGYVELRGLAHPHQGTSRAHLSGTPCLWYRFRVEQRRKGGRGDRWVTLDRGESDAPFLVDDGSGPCRVEPLGATVHCHRRDRWTGASRDPRGRSRASLGLGDRIEIPLGGSGPYRFTEERIEDGDPLYILGRLETPRRGPEERERLRRSLLGVWKRDPARVAALDTDGDGEIGPQEWERARAQAAQVAEHAEGRRSRAPVLPVVRATGDPRHPFLISTHTEEDLIRTLSWTVAGTILGFLALVTALGYVLAGRLGTWS